MVEAFAPSWQQTSFEVADDERVGSHLDPNLPRHQNLIEAWLTTTGAQAQDLLHDVAGLALPRSSLSVPLTRWGWRSTGGQPMKEAFCASLGQTPSTVFPHSESCQADSGNTAERSRVAPGTTEAFEVKLTNASTEANYDKGFSQAWLNCLSDAYLFTRHIMSFGLSGQ